MPIMIQHTPVGPMAQMAQNIGGYKTGQDAYKQSLERQRADLEGARLQQLVRDSTEKRQQQYFANDLDVLKLNRQWARDDATTGYKYDKLGQDDEHFDITSAERTASRQQRLQELDTKLATGTANQLERLQAQKLRQEDADAAALQRLNIREGGLGERLDKNLDYRAESAAIKAQRDRDIADAKNAASLARVGASVDRGRTSMQAQALKTHLARIKSDLGGLQMRRRRALSRDRAGIDASIADASDDYHRVLDALYDLAGSQSPLKQQVFTQDLSSMAGDISREAAIPQAPMPPQSPTFQPKPMPQPFSGGESDPTDIRAQNQLDLSTAIQTRAGTAKQDDWRGLLSEKQRLNNERYGFPVSPVDPAFETAAGEYKFGGMPPSIQGSESGYYVGQVIPTPAGRRVRIVGFDQDGTPIVRPQ